MIVYIAFFDKVANRYCSDLIPVDDDTGAVKLRLAKRFTFSKYCSFVKPSEIECRELAMWDSESKGLIPLKHPAETAFTLDQVDGIYSALAKKFKVDVPGVSIQETEVKPETDYGDFVRKIEKEMNNNEKQI